MDTSPGRAGGGDRPAPLYPAVNLALLLVLLGGLLVLAALEVTPARTVREPLTGRDLPATCAHLAAHGRPCPSCGLTRSLVSAAHGDFAASRAFHPAGVPVLVMLLAQIGMRVAFLWPRLRCPPLDVAASAAMAAAFAVLVN